MKPDLRHATDTVLSLIEAGQKEVWIDRCDLSPDEIDVLKRVWVKRQSRVEIALDKAWDTRTVDRHYRHAMLILCRVIEQNRK